MNWMERARREIAEARQDSTAKTAKANPMAVMTVPHPGFALVLKPSVDSNGGAPPASSEASEATQEAFEERAAIMEHDGGLNRVEAEQEASGLASAGFRFH